MKQFLTLFKVELKLQLGLQSLKEDLKSGPKGIAKAIGYIVLALVLIGSLGFAYLFFLDLLFGPACKFGMGSTLVGCIMLLAMVTTFIFGILKCLGLYFSRDVDFLFAMPISSRVAFLGKFTPIFVSEVLLNALIIVPGLIIYTKYASVDAMFWVKMVPVVLFSAAIPMALATLVSWALMGASALVKHKDKILLALSVLFFVGYMLAVQYLSAGMETMDEVTMVIGLLTGGILESITSAFPPACWAAEALVYGGSTGMNALLLYLGVSIGALVLSMYVAGRSFGKLSGKQTETAKSEKQVDMEKSTKQRGVMAALVVKEWRSILRSPVYTMNSLVPVLVGPIMVFSVFLIPRGDIGTLNEFLASVEIPPDIMGYIGLGMMALMYFLGFMSPGAATVYTREGQAVWVLKTLPVEPKKILMSKLIFAFMIDLLAIGLMAVLLVLVAGFLPLGLVLLAAVGAIITSMPVLIGSVLIDMQKPNLTWINETAAIKRGRSVMLQMLLGFGYMAVLGGLVYLLFTMGAATEVVWAVLLGLSGVLSAIIFVLLFKHAAPMLQRMGE